MSILSAVAAVRDTLAADPTLAAMEATDGTIAFDAPLEQMPDAIVRMVYADAGNTRLRTHSAAVGVAGITSTMTIRVDVVTTRSDVAESYARLMPYVDPIGKCLFRAWTNIAHRIDGEVAHLGDPRTPGATAPFRWTIEGVTFGGASYLALRCALDIAIEEDVA